MAKIWLLGTGGRIGNKLLVFAAMYAWALDRGHTLYCPTLYRFAAPYPKLRSGLLLSPMGGLPSPLLVRRQAQRGALSLLRVMARRGRLGPGLSPQTSAETITLPPTAEQAELDSAKSVWAGGWYFRNPVGLTKYRRQILEALTPEPAIVADADEFSAAWPKDRLCVGVHIRRTDYKEHLGGVMYFELDRYRAEMEAVRQRFAARRPFFVIFSDEAREESEFAGFDVAISRGSAIQDLYRMTRLKALIGPPSTFSMFAMYAGGGVAMEIGRHPDEHLTLIEDEPIARSMDAFEAMLRKRGAV